MRLRPTTHMPDCPMGAQVSDAEPKDIISDQAYVLFFRRKVECADVGALDVEDPSGGQGGGEVDVPRSDVHNSSDESSPEERVNGDANSELSADE